MSNIPAFWPDDLQYATREELVALLIEYQKIVLAQDDMLQEYKAAFDEVRGSLKNKGVEG